MTFETSESESLVIPDSEPVTEEEQEWISLYAATGIDTDVIADLMGRDRKVVGDNVRNDIVSRSFIFRSLSSWDQEEKIELIDLVKDGKGTYSISEHMDRTLNEVSRVLNSYGHNSKANELFDKRMEDFWPSDSLRKYNTSYLLVSSTKDYEVTSGIDQDDVIAWYLGEQDDFKSSKEIKKFLDPAVNYHRNVFELEQTLHELCSKEDFVKKRISNDQDYPPDTYVFGYRGGETELNEHEKSLLETVYKRDVVLEEEKQFYRKGSYQRDVLESAVRSMRFDLNFDP